MELKYEQRKKDFNAEMDSKLYLSGIEIAVTGPQGVQGPRSKLYLSGIEIMAGGVGAM